MRIAPLVAALLLSLIALFYQRASSRKRVRIVSLLMSCALLVFEGACLLVRDVWSSWNYLSVSPAMDFVEQTLHVVVAVALIVVIVPQSASETEISSPTVTTPLILCLAAGASWYVCAFAICEYCDEAHRDVSRTRLKGRAACGLVLRTCVAPASSGGHRLAQDPCSLEDRYGPSVIYLSQDSLSHGRPSHPLAGWVTGCFWGLLLLCGIWQIALSDKGREDLASMLLQSSLEGVLIAGGVDLLVASLGIKSNLIGILFFLAGWASFHGNPERGSPSRAHLALHPLARWDWRLLQSEMEDPHRT